MSHKYSIGEKSRLYGGHSMTTIWFSQRGLMQILATCSLALSCWNVKPIRPTCCMRTWLQYFSAIRVPSVMTRGVLKLWVIPSHTSTEQSPKRSRSTTHVSAFCSPCLLYTCLQPSERKSWFVTKQYAQPLTSWKGNWTMTFYPCHLYHPSLWSKRCTSVWSVGFDSIFTEPVSHGVWVNSAIMHTRCCCCAFN